MNYKIPFLVIVVFCFILFGVYSSVIVERKVEIFDIDGQEIEEVSATQYDRLDNIDRLIMQDISKHMNRIEPTDGEETPWFFYFLPVFYGFGLL